MLSFAGRVTLLKSVLASIPVYYMTVAALSPRTITEMNRLFRRFVWGKLETDKYISFVAWGKICDSTDNGGLGVRDTKKFNNSLLLKVAWQLAADEDRIWVKVFRAKYFPRAGFWNIKNTRDSSSLWKSVQGLKVFFENSIKWQIGDGKGIAALNQPWFQNWCMQTIRSNEQRDLKVADLFDQDSGMWKVDKIRELFGAQAIQTIMAISGKPQVQPLIHDRLIWTGSNKGRYSTKEGYKMLVQQRDKTVYEPAKIEAWKRIWSWKRVIPRVKMFLWKAVHGAIATLAELHKRIRPICPKCPRCGEENEFTNHVIFFCPLSRATWFMSELALRVNDLPLDFTKALLDLTDAIDENQIPQLCNLIWCIWKARNEVIFQAKTPTPFSIVRQAKQMDPPSCSEYSTTTASQVDQTRKVSIPPNTSVLLIDASWDVCKKAGWGGVIYQQTGQIQEMSYGYMNAEDPFHSEALALLQCIKRFLITQPQQLGKVRIFSDCKSLVSAVNANMVEDLPSWKAAETVAECANWVHSRSDRISLRFVRRDALKGPHLLANWARRNQVSSITSGGGQEEHRLGVEDRLSREFFLLENG